MRKKLIIVLVGLSLAGKDTVADYLVKKGFVHFSLADILRGICQKRGQYRDRDDLIRIANELRKRYGYGYLAKKGIQEADQLQADKLVFSSVRNPGEVKELKKHGNLFVVEVKAPVKVRYQRAKKRGKIDDQVTLSKFRAQENFERKGTAHQQQLDKVFALANFRIVNNTTRKNLFKKVDHMLNSILRRIKRETVLNIVVLGPQGSGKGTQAALLAKKFNLVHIGTGKIFRKIARRNNALGRKINYLINQLGKLVPFNFVMKVLKSELGKVSQQRGLIFDGLPRNLVQARALDKLLGSIKRQLTYVFYLPIAPKTTVKRLSSRRTCRKCSRIFIKGVTLKGNSQECPICGSEIYQREDDKPKAIAKRLEIYNKRTKPVINYYKKKGILIKVDGEPSIAVVSQNILKYLPK